MSINNGRPPKAMTRKRYNSTKSVDKSKSPDPVILEGVLVDERKNSAFISTNSLLNSTHLNANS